MNFYDDNGKHLLTGLVKVGDVYKSALGLTKDESASVGAYPRKGNAPEVREGFTARFTGYELTDSEWVSVYAYDPIQYTEAGYNSVLEECLRKTRDERGYADREPSDYAGSSVPQWASDARVWIAFRDKVMVYGLSVINHYKETGEVPTMPEFKFELAAIPCEWENV